MSTDGAAIRGGQKRIDALNKAFWDYLCGSSMAKQIGLKDHSPDDLRRFDRAYFDFYPYLLPYVPLSRMAGARVLEIGLGFGSLGQQIAEAGANYYGVDLARNPVALMNQRLRYLGRPATAHVGNVLDLPFPPDQFDFVVSIGTLHHTGNILKAIAEVHRVLRENGTTVLMLYNKHSLRAWREIYLPFVRNWARHVILGRPLVDVPTRIRNRYDSGRGGTTAPETDLSSIPEVWAMMRGFSRVKIRIENIETQIIPFTQKRISRPRLLKNVAKVLGLDLYVTATKRPRGTRHNEILLVDGKGSPP